MKLCTATLHRARLSASLLSATRDAAGPSCAWRLLRAAPPHDAEDSNALIMTAEIALRRDDCGRAAAELHRRRAAPGGRQTGCQRAADVALDCGQYQTAARAAARWRTAAAGRTRQPLHAAMRAELGLYKIDDARSAFESWIRGRRSEQHARGAAKEDAGEAGVAAGGAAAGAGAGVPATLAMLRGVSDRALQSGAAQLALADLALDGWNYREAVQYGQRALSAGARSAPRRSWCWRERTRASGRRTWRSRRRTPHATLLPRSRASPMPMY